MKLFRLRLVDVCTPPPLYFAHTALNQSTSAFADYSHGNHQRGMHSFYVTFFGGNFTNFDYFNAGVWGGVEVVKELVIAEHF
jgi:hypothetical protein